VDTKAEFFLSAGSIGRHRNWGYVKYFTPKSIYRDAKKAVSQYGAKKVSFRFAQPLRITSIIISY